MEYLWLSCALPTMSMRRVLNAESARNPAKAVRAPFPSSLPLEVALRALFHPACIKRNDLVQEVFWSLPKSIFNSIKIGRVVIFASCSLPYFYGGLTLCFKHSQCSGNSQNPRDGSSPNRQKAKAGTCKCFSCQTACFNKSKTCCVHETRCSCHAMIKTSLLCCKMLTLFHGSGAYRKDEWGRRAGRRGKRI